MRAKVAGTRNWRTRHPAVCEAAGVTFTLRPLVGDDVPACAAILDALPEWFGIEAANAAYVAGLATSPGFVVTDGNQEVAGFVGLTLRNHASMRIEVMGVRPDVHRSGIGRRLVDAAIERARADGVRWLHVMTRGPTTYDEDYERTRRFYLAVGFEPLYESLTEWGPDDAALVLVMTLGGAATDA